jgi:hypothetical protein
MLRAGTGENAADPAISIFFKASYTIGKTN